jgi:hypothetical protein
VEAGGSPLEIRLPQGLAIRGTVLDPAGRPVAGARVLAQPEFEGAAFSSARSGPDGTFEARNLVAGSWRLTARARIPGAGEAEASRVDAGATGIVLRLPEVRTIAGRVLGPDGLPHGSRGRIRVLDAAGNQVASTRWDATGSFETGGVPPGTYTLSAEFAGPPALAGTATARAGAVGVEVRLAAK